MELTIRPDEVALEAELRDGVTTFRAPDGAHRGISVRQLRELLGGLADDAEVYPDCADDWGPLRAVAFVGGAAVLYPG